MADDLPDLSDETLVHRPMREGRTDDEIVARIQRVTGVDETTAWAILMRARGEFDELEKQADI